MAVTFPKAAGAAAAAVSAHILFWELLRAARGDYWSGWSSWETAGVFAGAAVYFGVTYVVIVGIGWWMARVAPRLRPHAVGFLASLVPGVLLWLVLALAWEGARLAVFVPIGASLLLGLSPLLKDARPRTVVVMGTAPAVGGIVAALALGHAAMLEPGRRLELVPFALVYYVAAWAILAGICALFRNRRGWPVPVIVATILMVLPWMFRIGSGAGPQRDRPNLILITVDALRADYCEVYGGHVPTSGLARVAERGLVVERAYALGPWTLPSMTGLFASMYPPSLTPGAGRDAWVEEMRYYRVPPDTPMLAERLRDAGYATYAVVANKLLDQPDGLLRGFERHAAFHSSAPCHRGVFAQLPFLQALVRTMIPATPSAVDTTRPLRDLAVAFIQRHRTQPFFLWVHFMDPHAPWDPPDRFRAMDGSWRLVDPSDIQWGGPQFEPGTHRLPLSPEDQAYVRSLYDGEIRYVDEAIGTVLDTIADAGIEGNTVIAISADHGEEFWEHGEVTHGQSLVEELIRVPLLLAGPGLDSGRVEWPFSQVDLMPTLSDALGIAAPAEWRGESRWEAFASPGEAAGLRDVFAQGTYIVAPEPMRAVIQGSVKVTEGLESGAVRVAQVQHEREALPDAAALRDRGVTAMTRWWERFPATMDAFRHGLPDIEDDAIERLRSLGYLD